MSRQAGETDSSGLGPLAVFASLAFPCSQSPVPNIVPLETPLAVHIAAQFAVVVGNSRRKAHGQLKKQIDRGYPNHESKIFLVSCLTG